jgi:hypothetical protein
MTETTEMVQPTQAGRDRFDAVLDELKNELDVVHTFMLGMPSVKRRDGKAFAGLYGDDMVFRLSGLAHASALALDGAHLFEPMVGQALDAWVQVPPTHETQWVELARKAEAGLET